MCDNICVWQAEIMLGESLSPLTPFLCLLAYLYTHQLCPPLSGDYILFRGQFLLPVRFLIVAGERLHAYGGGCSQ